MATRKNKLASDFCRCIKKVRKTIKLRPGVKIAKSKDKQTVAKEAAAIGVCVKAVLQTKGKTLKRFRCGKKMMLSTQKPLKGGSLMGAPYTSTDPTASRITPGVGVQAYYENAVKAPVRL
jgi:hypothetical protein